MYCVIRSHDFIFWINMILKYSKEEFSWKKVANLNNLTEYGNLNAFTKKWFASIIKKQKRLDKRANMMILTEQFQFKISI